MLKLLRKLKMQKKKRKKKVANSKCRQKGAFIGKAL
jgi:hypothetical protein